MFSGKKMRGVVGKQPLPPSLKFTRIRNDCETKKLKKSVDKYQKEVEKHIRDLSTQQTKLLSSRRRKDRGGSLRPVNSPNVDRERRQINAGRLSGSVSDSALDRHSSVAPRGEFGKSACKGDKLHNCGKNDSPGSPRSQLPPLIIPSIQFQEAVFSPKSPQSPKGTDVLSKWKQIAKNVSFAKNLPTLQQMTLGPTIPSSKRRGSVVFERSSQFGFASEHSLVVPRHRRRRGSCPAIGCSGGELFGQERKRTEMEEMQREAERKKQMEELKACRYLRLPISIDEGEEEGEDTFSE